MTHTHTDACGYARNVARLDARRETLRGHVVTSIGFARDHRLRGDRVTAALHLGMAAMWRRHLIAAKRRTAVCPYL